jgi:hypothetical protein
VGIGIRIWKLWHRKVGVLASLAIALVAACWSVEDISLAPPGLTQRSLEMATATTHVIIDTPDSTMIDLRQDTYSVDGLTNRAILLGNVIASSGVEAKIADRAHVPLSLLRIQAPLTRAQSSPPVDSQNARHTSDILKSANQYRINIKVNATVPMMDIYAQSPSAGSAAALANASVDELRAYLTTLASRQKTPDKDQIRLVQLGRATGIVINHGVEWQVALITFLLTFLGSCAMVTVFARVRTGWRQAALADRDAAAAA